MTEAPTEPSASPNPIAKPSDNPGRRAAIALAVTVALLATIVAIWGDTAYPWLKAAHVVAIISWMAGLLYLPRLFIYHCDAETGSVQSETFKVMEQRLFSVIMMPAMVIAWLLGLWLAYTGGYLTAGWFLAKVVLVIGLSGVHDYLGKSVRRFAADANDKPARHWRIVNEVPTILMIGIVILVIVKPF